MDGIEILIEEHENIRRALRIFKQDLIIFMNQGGTSEDIVKFRAYIDFIKYYADHHHHHKEEEILFKVMGEELGEIAQKLVQYGMMQEHSTARFLVQEMEDGLNRYEVSGEDESKLDFLGSATAYVHHLDAHIERENKVVFPFAIRELSSDSIQFVNKSSRMFEEKEAKSREHYLGWLENLQEGQ